MTLTVTQQQSFIANFNSMGAASVTADTAGTAAILAGDTAINYITGTLQPAANTLSANGTIIDNDVSACSTDGTVVTNDIRPCWITGINGQMYVVYDPAYVSDVAILVQELNAILNYLQTNGSIA